MSATDLRYSQTQPASTALRFGATGGPAPIYHAATMLATAPRTVRAAVATRQSYFATLAATVGLAARPVLTTAHDNAVNRAPQAWLASPWAPAAARASATGVAHAAAARREHRAVAGFLPGTSRRGEVAGRWEWMLRHARPQAGLPWDGARAAGTHVDAGFAELVRTPRPMLSAPLGQARPLRAAVSDGWITLFRTRRPEIVAPWGDGQRTVTLLGTEFESGRAIHIARTIPWEEARRPPPGVSVFVVVPPGRPPCYNPLPGDPVILRFQDLATVAADLRFRCPNWTPPGPGGATVVIPILRSYIVHNDILLKRTDNNLVLPALALSLSIDADSWCWGWSASLPAAHLDNVLPANGQAPVEFEAVINGVHWLLLGEKVRRDRRFGSARIALSGRGIAAELGAPYAPAVSRTNTGDLTAQQIMDAALQINGVGIGWSLNWGLVDWLVPAGIWNHTGSHIEAVARIAEAGGGYIQASRTAKTLNILPRYPVLPWEWQGSVVPDFSLPAAVTTTESVEWQDNPGWNAIYVSGEQAGILAQVKRQGTAGDLVAPMIVDPLNTHVDAARQRGSAVLGTAGRILRQTLETPILPGVGLYPVGSFVEFVDGATTRLGMVRGVSVNANLPVVRQTIEVECHA